MIKNEYKYGKFIYRLDENNNFKVESTVPEPEIVYKYYLNNEFNKDAFLNQYLFCSHPFHLNDSMDCSNLLWNFSNITKNNYDKFFEWSGLNRHIEVNYEEDRKNGFVKIRHYLFYFITKGAGIISLTTEPLHILMWAHYSSERGFMVELDFKAVKENLTGLNKTLNNYAFFPIQYVDTLEQIDCFQKGFNSQDVPFLYSVGVKRNDWSYENEWRLISFANNYGIPDSIIYPSEDIKGTTERKIYYPKKAINAIVLGKSFFNGWNISKIINGQTYELKKSSDLSFIDYLYKNFNDRIYMCGELEKSNKLVRSTERIELKKKDDCTFELIRTHQGFHQ